jgi:hypothetical protein
MLLNEGFPSEKRAGNAHPKVGAATVRIGPNVTGVGRTFIDHF